MLQVKKKKNINPKSLYIIDVTMEIDMVIVNITNLIHIIQEKLYYDI